MNSAALFARVRLTDLDPAVFAAAITVTAPITSIAAPVTASVTVAAAATPSATTAALAILATGPVGSGLAARFAFGRGLVVAALGFAVGFIVIAIVAFIGGEFAVLVVAFILIR
ncbi:MAG: hypothetical protein JNL80_04755 [Phycisphaerae bacterium]|nr:hypothetical protein [Phycisphaerae bacterium]